MKEVWKDISGFEGYYQVSNFGNVRSVDRIIINQGYPARYTGKPMKPANRNKGYLGIILTKNNKPKSFLIHRLVADAFIPNPKNFPQVNHIDEDKKNNRVDNLEWCDCKYNLNYGNCTKNMSKARKNNTFNQKAVICVETGEYYANSCDAQRKTGVYARNIRSACAGAYKTAGGYHWKWKNDRQRK